MLNKTNDGNETSKQIVPPNADSDRIQAFDDQQDYLDLDEGNLF